MEVAIVSSPGQALHTPSPPALPPGRRQAWLHTALRAHPTTTASPAGTVGSICPVSWLKREGLTRFRRAADTLTYCPHSEFSPFRTLKRSTSRPRRCPAIVLNSRLNRTSSRLKEGWRQVFRGIICPTWSPMHALSARYPA